MDQKVIVWNGENTIPADASRALIVAANGLFALKRIQLGGLTVLEAVTRHAEPWQDDSLISLNMPAVSIGFAEKIPHGLIERATAFFAAVQRKYHTEAVTWLWYAPMAPSSQHWNIMAPEQFVESGRVKANDPGGQVSGWFHAGYIHSHNNFNAFHSGTDNGCEKWHDGIHITIGNVGTIPTYAPSVVVDGIRYEVALSDLVSVRKVEFPVEWMKQVHFVEPQVSAFERFGEVKKEKKWQTVKK